MHKQTFDMEKIFTDLNSYKNRYITSTFNLSRIDLFIKELSFEYLLLFSLC